MIDEDQEDMFLKDAESPKISIKFLAVPIIFVTLFVIILLGHSKPISTVENTPSKLLLSSDWQPGYFDLKQFRYVIQQEECGVTDEVPDLLIILSSKPDDFKNRAAVRQTWGHPDLKKYGSFRLLFALGTVQSEHLQRAIVMENVFHGDILQGSFNDSYYNLTYKTMMAIRWHKDYCFNAKVMLKADTDILLNTPIVLHAFKTKFWDTLSKKNPEFILCAINFSPPVIRNVSSKYYVPKDLIKDHLYPKFCFGPGMFFSNNASKKLYETGYKKPYFKFEDVYITGYIRREANMTLFNMEYLFDSELLSKARRNIDDHLMSYFFGTFHLSPELLIKLWNRTMRKAKTLRVFSQVF